MNKKIIFIIFLILTQTTQVCFATNQESLPEKKKQKKNSISSTSIPTTYEFLPNDVQSKILHTLRGRDVGIAAQVNSVWNGNFKIIKESLPGHPIESNLYTYDSHYLLQKELYSKDLKITQEYNKNLFNSHVELFFEMIIQGDYEQVKLLYNQFEFDLNQIKDQKYSASPLFLAAKFGNEKILNFFLSKGSDAFVSPEKAEYSNVLPLVIAAYEGHFNIVKILYNQKTLQNYSFLFDNNQCFTPLWGATANDQVEIVTYFLNSTDDPSIFFKNQHACFETSLTAASRRGNTQIIKILLDAGAPVNYYSKKVQNPETNALWNAAIHGKVDAVHLLIDRGAKIDLSNLTGMMILDQVSIHNYWDVFQYLLESHKKNYELKREYVDHLSRFFWSAIEMDKIDIIEYLIQYGVNITNTFIDPNSGEIKNALHFAAERGREKIVKLILKESKRENFRQLRDSIFKASSNGFKEIVNLIIEANKSFEYPTDFGSLLLESLRGAINNERYEIVTLILNKYKELESSIQEDLWEDFSEIFYEELKNGNLESVKIFVDSNISLISENLSTLDDENYFEIPGKNVFASPLYIASKYNRRDILEFLLSFKIATNPGLKSEWFVGKKNHTLSVSPLFAAAKEGHLDIVKILLDAGADSDIGFELKEYFSAEVKFVNISPLYISSEKMHTNVVQLFVDENVNLDLGKKFSNGKDCSPLFASVQNCHPIISKILHEAGATNIEFGIENESYKDLHFMHYREN